MQEFFGANKQWKMKIFTRKPEGAIAKGYASKGAEICHGDLKQKETLEAAMKGVNSVFVCLEPWEIGGVQEETRIGKEIVDMAVRHKIEHFVYSSVASSQDNTGIPHFDSKWKVEQHLMNSGLAYTIIKPVSFMENFLMFKEQISKGILPLPILPSTRLQSVACKDIGACAVAVLNNKKEWEGKSFELAGDELTGAEYAKALNCKFEETPLEKVPNEEMRLMYKWFNEKGFHVDIDKVKKMCPNMLSFKQWGSSCGLKMTEGTQ